MTRTEWLTARQHGIGATDIASIAGVGFRDAREVYAEKVAPAPIDGQPTPLMKMGLATEDHNAALYAERTGARLTSPGLIFSKSFPWMFSTFDRMAARENNSYPLELKYVMHFGDEWGEEGTDEIPDAYTIQAMWQMMTLTNEDRQPASADLAALSGNGQHRIYRIAYDERLAGMLLEIGRAFWQRVEKRAGADDWTHPLQVEVANRLAELRPDLSVELDESALAMARSYEDARAAEKVAKDEASVWRSQLLQVLAGAGEGRLPDGRRISQKMVNRKAYTVEASSYVDFRILSPKKVKVKNG